MAFIDGTVVNVALPALQKALNGSLTDVQWVVEAYALFLAALLLIGGSLGDRYGRRLIFASGVVLFTLASVCCGLALNIRQLILARAIQGLGGALLVPGSLALISASFAGQERGRAIGTWSGFTSITAAIGPVLGGWLVEHESWRWAFFINLPLGSIVLLLSLWKVPESKADERGARFDWLGGALASAGFGGVVFGLIEKNSWVGGAGAAVLLALVYWERRAPSPMIPLTLFHSRNFSGANLLTFFLYAALSGLLFFFPLDLIQIQDYTATQAGAALLPFILLMFVLSRWSGGLVDRYGSRIPLVLGPLITGIGFALFSRPGIGGSYGSTFFPAILVLGAGMAISVAPLTTTVMNAVDQQHAGTASGVNNAVSRVGGLLAVAVFGALLSGVFQSDLERRLSRLNLTPDARMNIEIQMPKLAAAETDDARGKQAIREAFVVGFRMVLWVSVGLSVTSSLSAAWLIRTDGRQS